jgi:hypothetical protein
MILSLIHSYTGLTPVPPNFTHRVPFSRLRQTLLSVVGLLAISTQAQVRINEIHYHPRSENVLEEFIELHNAGPTPVDLTGWRISKGVAFNFPSLVLPAGAYVVAAADPTTFTRLHPTVTNVVGGWTGTLSNSRETIALDDASGARIDEVPFADEGDWAVRRRGPSDHGHRGWMWFAPPDGGGRTLERITSALPSDQGQNWAASLVDNGTPGTANSVAASDIAPIIADVRHLPAVPRSAEAVHVTARLIDDAGAGSTAQLSWRLDGDTGPFTSEAMADDGRHDDGAPGDGLFGAFIPAQTNRVVVEFYVTATGTNGHVRAWPAPAEDTDGTPLGQVANALYLVQDSAAAAIPPLYRLVMKETDRLELASIGAPGSSGRDSDAEFNGAFVSLDGTGTEVRYTVGFRNRGHGSRDRLPNNYRVAFNSDRTWKGARALNLNGQYSHAQILGAALSLRSGVGGADSRPVRVRLNSVDPSNNGPQTYGGVYAANEVIGGDWAAHWFPDDSNGNVYRGIRDLSPVDFNYRGPNDTAYTNTWFKQSNVSENDWTDLKALLRVFGTNDLFTTANVRGVIDAAQWLDYLAVMALVDNRETSINTGYNDDYFLYAGRTDPRVQLMYFDLDTILNLGDVGGTPTASIFGSTVMPAFDRFLHSPDFEPLYYRTLQRLLNTTFSKAQFDVTVDQSLESFVPANVRVEIKSFMDARRAYVTTLISGKVPADATPPIAVVTGEPRARTPRNDATLFVAPDGVAAYRYQLNGGPFGPQTPAATPISLSNLPNGGTNTVFVVALGTNGVWQAETNATASSAWIVDRAWPSVRIDEVLAHNTAAFDHAGTFPDAIELLNEGPATVDLSGLRLTDDATAPDKFTLPAPTTLAAGGRLVVFASKADGTPGLHTGFSLSQSGEGVFLFDRVNRGGALLDSVEFGPQLPDLSISRMAGGAFVLSAPTLGAANLPQTLGSTRALRINEWLAAESTSGQSDELELYNPGDLPVALAGLFLTGNPVGNKTQHRIAPLTFIAPRGHLSFAADANPQKGPAHLGFKLSADQGLIALLDTRLEIIDLVAYGPQRSDVSEGRAPDGGDALGSFLHPTLGGANPASFPACSVSTTTVNLLGLGTSWRYNQTQNLDGQTWFSSSFADRAWPAGPGLLAFESGSWIAPLIGTPLTDPRTPPNGLSSGHTYYFRTAFVLTNDLSGYAFVAGARIDDGAVIYVNGVEAARVRMPAGPVHNTTLANALPPGGDATSTDTTSLPSSLFVQGTNVVAVEVHQEATASSDIVWGMSLDATLSVTNCDRPALTLSEVLASNRSSTNAAGLAPDWIELHNGTAAAIDLADLSLTDDPATPRRWVFAQGSSIPANGFLVIDCDSSRPASATNTGFALGANGDRLLLLARPADGGGALDTIAFGLQVTDFSLGRNPANPDEWILTLPTPAAPNIAATLAGEDALRVNEWEANPSVGEDWLELHNTANQPVQLTGLAVSDDPSQPAKSPFPPLSFIGAGRDSDLLLVADSAPQLGADHVAFKLSSSGEFIGIYRASGTVIDAVPFGPQALDVSEGRFPDGSTRIVAFPASASPGAPNYLPLADLVIDEVLSHSDPPLEDAVEVLNRGTGAVDLGGWFLSNSGNDPRRFRVPAGTTIPPGGFHVFYESSFNGPRSADLPEPFTFNAAHGDEVHLSQPDGFGGLTGYRASARFGAAANGVSFGLHRTSVGEEFVAQSRRTFGQDTPATVAEFRTGTGLKNALPLVGPIAITEIHYHPTNSYAGDTNAGEFIELQNVAAESVPLFDPAATTNLWKIDGGVTFTFGPGLSLSMGGRALIVPFDPVAAPNELAWFRNAFSVSNDVPVWGPFTGALSNSGEDLRLLRPDPPQLAPHPDAGFVPYVLVEHVHYLPTTPWPTNGLVPGASFQRAATTAFGNEPANWFAAPPTAGRDNNVDTDHDGLPDYWEIAHGLDPLVASGDNGAGGDFDKDGVPNASEFQAGTDPNNVNDYLRVDLSGLAPGTATLQFVAPGSRSYSVLYSDVSPTGPWFKLADVPLSANSATVTLVDHAPNPAGRFYRLVTPAPVDP